MAMTPAFRTTENARLRSVRRSLGQPPITVQRFTTAGHDRLQRKPETCACGGGCPRCQAKSDLTIGAPDDVYEREADAVAERVMRMDEVRATTISPAAGDLQRRCARCDHENEPPLVQILSAAAAPHPTAETAPPSVRHVLDSPGLALSPVTRAYFEPRFGDDFSDVQVHTDALAARSAREMQAFAYTVGQHIVFDTGRFAPETREGRHLLAHELTHVRQQSGNNRGTSGGYLERTGRAGIIQRRVRPENVTCRATGLRNPDLTGDEVVAALQAADAEAIALAQGAETALTENLDAVRAGAVVDADFDTILQDELGLTLTNNAHFRLIQQQINRFRRVRETLESGYLRYMCRGSTVTPISIIGCEPEPCGDEFASSCPGNRLIVLCQAFWDEPGERAATILHEPFHIWFTMERHAQNALRRADASCFESFALRVAGQDAPASCVDHTAG